MKIRIKSVRKPKYGVWSNSLWINYIRDRERFLNMIFQEADRQGISDYKLAKLSGLSYGTVRNIEKRETRTPTYTTIFKLAKAMGYRMEYTKIK